MRRIELRRRAYFGRVKQNTATGNGTEQQCNDEVHHEATTAADANSSSSSITAAAVVAVVPRGRVLHSHLAAPPTADVSATSGVSQRSDQRSDQRSPTNTIVQSHEQQLWERFTLAKAVASAGSSNGSSASDSALVNQLIERMSEGSGEQLRSIVDYAEAQAVLQQAAGDGNPSEAGIYRLPSYNGKQSCAAR